MLIAKGAAPAMFKQLLGMPNRETLTAMV